MKLLCLSNGHGEDAIAIRILRQLQQHPNPPDIVALPLVGEGQAYHTLNIPIIGTVQQMPSGGFVYMDGRQLMRDIKGGLLQLTLKQLQTIRQEVAQGGVILAVGDIVPLLFAWLSGANYAFVGTAKSEYFIRDESGFLPKRRWEGWSGSVYLPWERFLMSRRRCKAVFPRDSLTTEFLQKWSIPAYDLGNPMIDDLQGSQPSAQFYDYNIEQQEQNRPLRVLLLPGSRIPEAYDNWHPILLAVSALLAERPDLPILQRDLEFRAAIASALNLETFGQILESYGWRLVDRQAEIIYSQRHAKLTLSRAYNDNLQLCDVAIAMAGTATEQFVGLGKPAIAIPGKGPQFTPAFAEAQSRLLGISLTLAQPQQVPDLIQQLFRNPDYLQLIAENGKRRMGKPGASSRIAACLSEKLL